jgi:hypothetical protein
MGAEQSSRVKQLKTEGPIVKPIQEPEDHQTAPAENVPVQDVIAEACQPEQMNWPDVTEHFPIVPSKEKKNLSPCVGLSGVDLPEDLYQANKKGRICFFEVDSWNNWEGTLLSRLFPDIYPILSRYCVPRMLTSLRPVALSQPLPGPIIRFFFLPFLSLIH